MQTLLGKQWRSIPAEEVLRLLQTNADKGLDLFAIERRLEHIGPNALTKKQGDPLLLLGLMLAF